MKRPAKTKTLYVSEENEQLWMEAELLAQISGTTLSNLIPKLLREWTTAKDPKGVLRAAVKRLRAEADGRG